MLRVGYGGHRDVDITGALHSFPHSDLSKPTRSTVPMLCYWRRPAERLRAICNRLGLAYPETATLLFEYPVESGVPRSRASMTDLMCQFEGHAIGVEAKWTEGRYRTVRRWLENGNDRTHRESVLRAWLGFLGPFCEADLNVDSVQNVVYQTLHRAAATCATAQRNAFLVYQCFSAFGSEHRHVHADLIDFVRTVRARPSLRVAMHSIELAETDAFRALVVQLGLCGRTAADRAPLIRDAVLQGALFDFGAERWIELS